MSISPQFLDEIRNRLSLSDIIGKRIKVMRAGREHKACCPFHHEKTPSFTINDDKQFYHCFGCGAHGDVIKFVMEHDNLPFIEAVEMLSAEAGLQMPTADPRAIEAAKKATDLYDVMAAATQWLQAQLYHESNRDILMYARARGVTDEALQAFHIGYAPPDGAAFVAHMKGQGFKVSDLMELGLVKKSAKNGDLYAFFRERVMFPVQDRRGRVIAFGGRTLPDHMRAPSRGDFKPPKYLNSPDNPLFDKGRVLYGEDKARKAARDDQPVLVTEGYMDVVACWQAGFHGAVAPMGTALTEGQIDTLWKMIPADFKEPLLCFDGDNAGRKAATRAAERILPLLTPGASARFVFMPQGEDPDSLIKAQGAGALAQLLRESISLVEYVWRTYTAAASASITPERRAAIVKNVRSAVETIAHDDVKAHYRADINQRISDRFFAKKNQGQQRSSYGGGGLYGQKGRFGSGRGGVKPAPIDVKPRALQGSARHDVFKKILLAAVINHPELFDHVEESLSQMSFADEAMAHLKRRVIAELSMDPDLSAHDLQDKLAGAGLVKEMRDILSDNIYIHAAFAAPCSDSGEKDLHDITTKWQEIWQALEQKQAQIAQKRTLYKQIES